MKTSLLKTKTGTKHCLETNAWTNADMPSCSVQRRMLYASMLSLPFSSTCRRSIAPDNSAIAHHQVQVIVQAPLDRDCRGHGDLVELSMLSCSEVWILQDMELRDLWDQIKQTFLIDCQ